VRRAAVALAVALLACGGAERRAAAPPRAVLVVRCALADAVLVVDEQAIGELAALRGGVRIAAGRHRVELRHDGYHTRYAEVALAAGETRTLELTLVEAYP
jgi:hypothetical protein